MFRGVKQGVREQNNMKFEKNLKGVYLICSGGKDHFKYFQGGANHFQYF